MKEELVRAIDLMLADPASGDRWDEAHEIAQRHEDDATARWMHAVLHKIEGDLANSRYWYRLADRLDQVDSEPLAELRSIRRSLTQ